MRSQQPQGPVRVRFAPSPTGFLHVGGARTAIYNDLLRQNVGGAFVLRIEDTDRARSDAAMTRQIEEALAWLGIEWDEGPFLQSERLTRHRERVDELLGSGSAYRCFCSPEALDAARREAERGGSAFRYPRTCRAISDAESTRRAAAGETFAVRLAMPDEPIRLCDLVRGDVEFAPEVLDDFILLRSDGTPTYHLSVVVDDVDMGISHVIRGEDHLSNTPKHVALFRALGASVPAFGHLPLILGPDRKRLSKRFGATSVEEFKSSGILPQALYNYLALLGWMPDGEREILSRREMAAIFTLDRLNASGAVFDPETLEWGNGQYLSALSAAELARHAAPLLAAAGLGEVDRTRLLAVLDLAKSRPRNLRDLVQMVEPFFRAEVAYDVELLAVHRGDPRLPEQLEALSRRWSELPAFDKAALEAALRALAAERGLKAGQLIHPTRLALTGVKAGPSLFDIVEVMGRAATVRHLERLARELRVAPE